MLLSSKQLSLTGLFGGANTHEFNSQTMKTNDNVFFFPVPQVTYAESQTNVKGGKIEFGTHRTSLGRQYALERGYISAYVMTPNELLETYRRLNPAHHSEVMKLLKPFLPYPGVNVPLKTRQEWQTAEKAVGTKSGPEARLPYSFNDAIENFFRRHPSELDKILKELHRFDFTLEDYESIVRTQLLVSLAKMRKTDPSEFQRQIRLLQTPGAEIEALLEAQVFRPLNLPAQFELKVPEAVPAKQLERPSAVSN